MRPRRAADEALGMGREGGIEDEGALGELGFNTLMMDVVRREQRESAVMMLEVVPIEEVLAECTSVVDTAESSGEVGAYLSV